jgi:peptidoglycan biosynthesis protein MviN/MurJ (putative lipid II flippase)
MEDPGREQQIARSATLVSIGNVLSRVMGLARESAIADIFGASGAVSAYTAASQVPLTLYEMLVGGMVSSALVPTLSGYATQERRDELWRVANLLFTLVSAALGVIVLLLEIGAPLVSRALVQFDAPLQAETTRLLRIVVLAVFFLGLSGVATSLCHALQRFALPAFTTVVFNASIVLVTVVLGPRWIEQVKNPTLDNVLIGDLVAGQLTRQEGGALLAEDLAVIPSADSRPDLLGRVIGREGDTLVIEGAQGAIRLTVNAGTHLRISRKQVRVLAIGLVIGAALQVLLQLPALRDMRFRPSIDLQHPVLRHILRLYAPVILSLVVASLGVFLDRNLASRTGESSISWMRYATTLREFPLGLVSMAIATAILPTLSRLAAEERGAPEKRAGFEATLAGGLRLVLVLTLPAAMGLLILAKPLVALLFQHGDFSAYDTAQTATALRYYLIGMLGAAVDQPLIFAFYARQDTLRPALVGIAGVAFYALVALSTLRSLGMIGLILANGAQLFGHALVMLALFERRVGTLRGRSIGPTLLKSLFASAIMGGAVYGIGWGIRLVVADEGLLRWALTVVVGGGVGLAVYVALCALLRVRELDLARALVRRVVRP